MTKALIVMVFLVVWNVASQELESPSTILQKDNRVLSRNKRWLVWKEGVNWVSMIFGLGIPVEVNLNSVVMGSTIKAYYLLPDNSSVFTNPSIGDYQRKRRSASRWKIYELIESYLEQNHYEDGKACLLKSICQISAIKLEERSGLLAEIVHNILTPSSTKEELEDHTNYAYHFAEKVGKQVGKCDHVFPECSVDPIHQFSRLMTV
ncbi:uncharacterized protein [Euwallacea fornicatus]|uniref:uncharacterized protein n=1 Tax=Euwallacea fornicatus TaxID=995702 RepID=UPI00338DD022